jgi:hypothetical protein
VTTGKKNKKIVPTTPATMLTASNKKTTFDYLARIIAKNAKILRQGQTSEKDNPIEKITYVQAIVIAYEKFGDVFYTENISAYLGQIVSNKFKFILCQKYYDKAGEATFLCELLLRWLNKRCSENCLSTDDLSILTMLLDAAEQLHLLGCLTTPLVKLYISLHNETHEPSSQTVKDNIIGVIDQTISRQKDGEILSFFLGLIETSQCEEIFLQRKTAFNLVHANTPFFDLKELIEALLQKSFFDSVKVIYNDYFQSNHHSHCHLILRIITSTEHKEKLSEIINASKDLKSFNFYTNSEEMYEYIFSNKKISTLSAAEILKHKTDFTEMSQWPEHDKQYGLDEFIHSTKHKLSQDLCKLYLNDYLDTDNDYSSDNDFKKIEWFIEKTAETLGVNPKEIFLAYADQIEMFIGEIEFRSAENFMSATSLLIKSGMPISILIEKFFFKKAYKEFFTNNSILRDKYKHCEEDTKRLGIYFDEIYPLMYDTNGSTYFPYKPDEFISLLTENITMGTVCLDLSKEFNTKLPFFLAMNIDALPKEEARKVFLACLDFISEIKANIAGSAQLFSDYIHQFFNTHQFEVKQAIDIMGEDAFFFLKSFLNKNPAHLERSILAANQEKTSCVSLSSALSCAGPISEKTLNMLKHYYKENRKELITPRSAFYQTWEYILLISSKIFPAIDGALNIENSAELSKFYRKYIKFLTLFIKVNNRQRLEEPAHFRDYVGFYTRFSIRIGSLIEIMGDGAFDFFKKYIAKTVISLERLLNNIFYISPSDIQILKIYFDKYKNEIFDGTNSYKLWENILTITCVNTNATPSVSETSPPKEFATNLSLDMAALPRTLAQANNMLVREFVLQSISTLELTEDERSSLDFEKLIKKIPTIYFTKLVLAQKKMQYNCYRHVFTQILKAYFLYNNIEHVIHAPQDASDAVLAKLGRHNAEIRQQLIAANVSLNCFNYDRKLNFNYSKASGDTSTLSILKTLVADAQQVYEQIKKVINTSDVPFCAAIIEQFQKAQTQLEALKSTPEDKESILKLLQVDERSRLQATYDDLNSLVNKLEKITHLVLPSEFYEFFNHFKDRYHLIENLGKVSNEKVPKNNFTVSQWDKNELYTLFLGTPVQCCLSPDGAQLPALIQRIMDDAMFFHVVTSPGSNEPVALSWLYFVTDKDNTSKIHVMANFLEIAPRYGADIEDQQMIVHALLYFTKQFCADIGVPEFLINNLSYGWIANFSCFESIEIASPQKVGGYLNLNEASTDTSEHYYLNSLYSQSFHRYDFERVPQDIRDNLNIRKDCISASCSSSFFPDQQQSLTTAHRLSSKATAY